MNKDMKAMICPVIDCPMPLCEECYDGEGFENECAFFCETHGEIEPVIDYLEQ